MCKQVVYTAWIYYRDIFLWCIILLHINRRDISLRWCMYIVIHIVNTRKQGFVGVNKLYVLCTRCIYISQSNITVLWCRQSVHSVYILLEHIAEYCPVNAAQNIFTMMKWKLKWSCENNFVVYTSCMNSLQRYYPVNWM